MLAEAVFWTSLAAVAYVYVGYPALLVVWRRLSPRPVRKSVWQPLVTLVIAAHNEVEHIEAKLNNCLALDYPPDKLRVVVSLDAPDDGTESVIARCTDPRVACHHCPEHKGKAAALNAALPLVEGEVIVFADARQRIERDAIEHLVANLGDPEVGAVSGELVLCAPDGAADEGGGVGAYWRYEKWLRRMESDIHSMLGATGALYAIRAELVEPLPEATILDDMLIPLRAVLRGTRVVFEPAARAYDRIFPEEREYRRKVRTLTGNYQLLALMPTLLSPRRNPVFVQFLSHKIGRLLVPYLLGAVLAASVYLHLTVGGIYTAALLAQAAFYSLAALGSLLVARRPAEDAETGLEPGAPTRATDSSA